MIRQKYMPNFLLRSYHNCPGRCPGHIGSSRREGERMTQHIEIRPECVLLRELRKSFSLPANSKYYNRQQNERKKKEKNCD
mmetsp:Transcript_40113/g.64676  ORF Transcript_40113/g.64676 Transcript_40113/m.64676 type:complete len:81 (+) Transcript_40113:369-611(+)